MGNHGGSARDRHRSRASSGCDRNIENRSCGAVRGGNGLLRLSAAYPLLVDPMTWPDLAAVQQPPWPDAPEVERAVAQLRALPPLVFAGECDLLTERLAQASRGEAFVLTGGDCAETFEANTADSIRARLKTVLQMSVVLTYAASLPVVKMGRLAGQYFKPRSKTVEIRDGVELTSYLGDAVNALAFDPDSRRPDPQRLVQAYHASGSALNLVRAFTQGGYADLRQVHAWNQDFVRDSAARASDMRNSPNTSTEHCPSCRRAERIPSSSSEWSSTPLTRHCRWITSGRAHRGSTHVPESPTTCRVTSCGSGSARVNSTAPTCIFASTISNPIGMKVGPTASTG